ncbi:MAG TPA: pyrimidine 5'-nucleotidase [Anaerolineaceae bacterium]|nr:pyrimidine 5'-nucleotidase [Anaerolineaceae bacterium]
MKILQPIDNLIFDLDDTIYLPNSGIWDLIGERIFAFMREHLPDVPEEGIEPLRDRLLKQYGTTLRGLLEERGIDMQAYLDYVHDIDLSAVLKPDLELRQFLSRAPQKKYIFTNASQGHAENVLTQMDLVDLFDGITGVGDVQPYCKPMPEAFLMMLQHFGISDPSTCLFADDNLPNLVTAQALGLLPVYVGRKQGHGFTQVERLADLEALLPDPQSIQIENPTST